MRTSQFLAPLFFAATSIAQAVEEGVAPDAAVPEGCRTTVEGKFTIGTLENPALNRRETAQEAADGEIHCTLEDGILHDQYGRTGSVVANRQFQFDGPPQAGAIYTGGFSVCGNDSLAIGGSTRWWRCMSGAFGNLYDEWIGDQCHEIRIQAVFAKSSTSSAMESSTTSSPLVGSTSMLSATSTDGLTSESRSPSGSATTTSGASGTGLSTVTTGGSATGTGSESQSSSEETQPADAPPAEGAASSFPLTPFAMMGASMVFLGAALVL